MGISTLTWGLVWLDMHRDSSLLMGQLAQRQGIVGRGCHCWPCTHTAAGACPGPGLEPLPSRQWQSEWVVCPQPCFSLGQTGGLWFIALQGPFSTSLSPFQQLVSS